jgi:MGT family glycosyltransferase
MNTRTYLFTIVDGGGTVPPELAVVRRLVERGHDVTVMAEGTMESEVVATGAAYRPWVQAPNRATRDADDDPFRDWECKNPKQLLDRMLDKVIAGPAGQYAADVDSAVADHRPDAIVCSQFVPGAMAAAEAQGIPFYILMPNIYLLPAEGLPPFGLGARPAKSVLGRTRDRVVHSLMGRMWDKGLDRLNAVRATRGLAPLQHFWDQAAAARGQLIMTSPAFDFPAKLPANARYVGAVLDDPAWVEPWTPPAGEEPLVLVALSSTFQDHVACLQRIADALGTMPVRAVLTTGPTIDPTDINARANAVVTRSAPHSQVLEHAAAVVTHGGHGTVVKALAAGVPLVVMPHGRDQADNATRVTARGAGVKVKNTAKAEAIVTAVRTVLDDPAYARAAAALGAAIRNDAASGLAVSALEDLPVAARA